MEHRLGHNARSDLFVHSPDLHVAPRIENDDRKRQPEKKHSPNKVPRACTATKRFIMFALLRRKHTHVVWCVIPERSSALNAGTAAGGATARKSSSSAPEAPPSAVAELENTHRIKPLHPLWGIINKEDPENVP
jgi:hypothetical protein